MGDRQAGERPAGGRGSVERGSRTGASGGWLYGRFVREVGYTLVCFPLAIVGFVYVVVALSTGPALAVTFLGIPLLATMLVGARGFGTVQRALAAEMLGDRVAPPRPLRPRSRGVMRWVRAGLRDGAGWRACVYLLVKFPLAITNFVVTVAFCSAGLGGVTYPVWQRYLPVQHDSAGRPHRGASFGTDYFLDTWPRMAMAVAAGAVLLYLARPLIHGLVGLDRLLIRGLLGPTNRQLAAERMHELELTRASAVDDSAAALRRIERDLHDGAQARLVSMAMNLGAVREQLATADGDSLDLDRTRSMVDAAHRDVKEALVELRDLARGIHPPILDHGLEAALESLAARGTGASSSTSTTTSGAGGQPVALHVDLPQRPSAAIETIAYFCAAELFTNAVKHGRADEIRIGVIGRAGRLRLTVVDDGTGGATLEPGGGLTGLVERVRTVDGWLDVTSPPGGPTRITIDLPLHA